MANMSGVQGLIEVELEESDRKLH